MARVFEQRNGLGEDGGDGNRPAAPSLALRAAERSDICNTRTAHYLGPTSSCHNISAPKDIAPSEIGRSNVSRSACPLRRYTSSRTHTAELIRNFSQKFSPSTRCATSFGGIRRWPLAAPLTVRHAMWRVSPPPPSQPPPSQPLSPPAGSQAREGGRAACRACRGTRG